MNPPKQNAKKDDVGFPEAYELGQRMLAQTEEETLIPLNKGLIQKTIRDVHRMIIVQFTTTNVPPAFAFDRNGKIGGCQ